MFREVSHDEATEIAREYIAWTRSRGLSPGDVCCELAEALTGEECRSMIRAARILEIPVPSESARSFGGIGEAPGWDLVTEAVARLYLWKILDTDRKDR